jgi:hypothetical protein
MFILWIEITLYEYKNSEITANILQEQAIGERNEIYMQGGSGYFYIQII